ncbi:MAG TPA: serine hydrolase domain-containing protein [Kofleriaceae bacterium]|jgi:CubicO group peptidase (beta-lactamase class C family)
MIRRTLALFALAACSSASKPAPVAPAAAPTDSAKIAEPPPPGPKEMPAEKMTKDTPRTTVGGNTFIAPIEWTVRVRGAGTILESPEGGSYVALYDVPAKDASDATTQAWAAYKGKTPYKLTTSNVGADSDGWSTPTSFSYDVPPNLKRSIAASALAANGMWTVIIFDMDQGVAEKRASQVGTMLGKLLPKGGARESFAGKTAATLDKAKIDALVKFVADAETLTGVPGVSFGIVQNGKVIYAGGVGVRQLGKRAAVDGDTKFMIASNTKALATLMLAKLVDEKKISWDTHATELLPSFKLGDAETTAQVLVKHLICACTGLPRQDFEWLFQWDGLTPEKAMATLATMQPTSKFGELFQYSNPLAAAAGFIGGHVVNPKDELGVAFDKAMQSLVFGPLKMTSTTLDMKKGRGGNAAVPESPDVDGKPALALAAANDAIIGLRPAGGAWSTVKDMLKYIQLELDNGTIGGKPYIGKEALLARRTPQVAIGTDSTYGMGLMVDKTWGVTVVHHGGDMIGFHSDMMWLPDQNVGAVILTNGDPGWLIRTIFQRKLLELLFDGKPEADAKMAAAAKSFFDEVQAGRKLLTLPADATEVAKLAKVYTSPQLGDIAVSTKGTTLVFDFGEYKSDVASKKNDDGTLSFVTIVPGMGGLEFVVGAANGKKTLTTRDGQHEYVFTEK